jgi:hypothetical protein
VTADNFIIPVVLSEWLALEAGLRGKFWDERADFGA